MLSLGEAIEVDTTIFSFVYESKLSRLSEQTYLKLQSLVIGSIKILEHNEVY